MKRKSTDYSTPDSGGWMNACDDIFLARFRGKPCEICGRTVVMGNRSCGHHLAEKGMHREHRYNPDLIVVLCTEHHSRFSRNLSPHADDTAAQARFSKWLEDNKPEQWGKLLDVDSKPFDHSWKYRDMYVTLGGEIESKTGLNKDYRPKNHSKNVIAIEELNK